MPALPIGIIALWSGSVATIPAGWALCDGTGATPDLRDRFIVGAGNTYAPAATGGALTHTHPFTSNLHAHSIPYGTGQAYGTNVANYTDNTAATGTTDSGSSLPPYYALCYIMRI